MEEWQKNKARETEKEKKDYTPFYGGVVIMVAGAAVVAVSGGWISNIVGILVLLFGICLVCVGWSTEHER